MQYVVYKTTNTVNGKFYIGCHKTDNIEDGYLGSGKLLLLAIKKYGIDAFVREILFVFGNAEDMFAKEAELVTEEFLAEHNTYNLKVGGFGGFDYLNYRFDNPTHSKEHLDSIRPASFYDPERRSIRGKMVRDQKLGIFNPLAPKKEWCRKGGRAKKGSVHSEDTKRRIGLANSSMVGERNSQFGTMWITDGTRSKKHRKTDPIPDGWWPGRSYEQN